MIENIQDPENTSFDATKEPLNTESEGLSEVTAVSGLYKNWFLEYASYVILERAVPAIEDGLKPVQRRILHSMKEMDDGRYNKVANIIGHTMQFHPHGDASIGEAVVNLGQKDLLIDTQGNWGDVRTGDGAAAPRYIEARLSKLGQEILFNPQTTTWQMSYDGRKKEPVALPVKFPLLLAQGVEGIAVGLATKILPHNFIELCDCSIAILQNKSFEIYPDFQTGGMIDVTDYKEGLRGGKIRVRAKIEDLDRKVLIIKDIPFGTTTSSLIDSIVKAADNGKIKIKKVIDNTAKDIEIQVQLTPGVSPDMTIDALYAFTDCEVSISPNACVIIDDKPQFISVKEILKICTQQTMGLLKRELEIRQGELMEKMLYGSLEKIFIENRIYRDIEECTTWESVLETIDKGLAPYKSLFYREINKEDLLRLTEIKIKRISKFDAFKADELMKQWQEELDQVKHDLEHLRDYTIKWYKDLIKKYGKGRERKTEIRQFDTIKAAVVAFNNQKLYINRKDGFVGFGLKKDEFVCDCSDLDDIIVFREDGKYKVVKIADKVFVGKNILYAAVFLKGDERTTYNVLYRDGDTGYSYGKRFQVQGVTRDREYDITKGAKSSKLLYFSANPNGEAEVVKINLVAGQKTRNPNPEFDFADLAIKGRSSQGNIITKFSVRKVSLLKSGPSTLGGLDIWYDSSIGKLNTTEHGQYLGKFLPEDLILCIHKSGQYELTGFDLSNRYEPAEVVLVEKYKKDKVINVLYWHGGYEAVYVKKFKIDTSTLSKLFPFIPEEKGTELLAVSTGQGLQVELISQPNKKALPETHLFDVDVVAELQGRTAQGNRILALPIKKAQFLENERMDEGVQTSLFTVES